MSGKPDYFLVRNHFYGNVTGCNSRFIEDAQRHSIRTFSCEEVWFLTDNSSFELTTITIACTRRRSALIPMRTCQKQWTRKLPALRVSGQWTNVCSLRVEFWIHPNKEKLAADGWIGTERFILVFSKWEDFHLIRWDELDKSSMLELGSVYTVSHMYRKHSSVRAILRMTDS